MKRDFLIRNLDLNVPGGGGGGNGAPSKGHLVDVVVARAFKISQGEVGSGCWSNRS